MYVCVYVCMYVCVYVCMYVCVWLYVYVYVSVGGECSIPPLGAASRSSRKESHHEHGQLWVCTYSACLISGHILLNCTTYYQMTI